MLCDICHKNIATVHLTEVINGKVAEMHICHSCAQLKAEELKEQLSVSDFLTGLTGTVETQRKEEISLKCSFCGSNYLDFKKKGRLGCGNCYVAFKQQLFPLLKKIHGSTRHIGKSPIQVTAGSSLGSKLKELKDRLDRAIQLEEYEDAARLRDEIKRLEQDKK
jgi:protein arginine kinase activator